MRLVSHELHPPERLRRAPAGRRGRARPRYRVPLGLALLALGGLAWLAAWTWLRAGPAECRSLAREDLSLDQMISVKRRVQAHERDPSAPLALTGAEASFLLRDNLEYPVHLAVEGDEVSAQLALPEGSGGRCYNVDFRGRVEVHEGVAQIVPTHLVVGELDLTRWLGGTTMALDPEDVQSDHARQLLGHTRELEVVDGHLEVRIEDLAELR